MNLGTLDFKVSRLHYIFMFGLNCQPWNRIEKEDNLCTNSFEYGKDGKENSFS